MSLNLHCEGYNLWQTPTHITFMCYSNNDGGWKGILYRYTVWVNSHLNGPYKSVEEYNEQRDLILEHLSQFNGCKKLKFSVV